MRRILAICLFALSTTKLYGATPWIEAIKATKHPVSRHYLIASYWSWREAVRWHSPTNRKWALSELAVAIEATKRFDPANKTALQLMGQIQQEVAK